ncbi:NAD-dependent epimerase/dehydratase family protein [Candidatus Dependentiae bacterium]|nr:NAD-dependent epimerase/dehydratase family protein [Candidatus Dependentiae bacterium]
MNKKSRIYVAGHTGLVGSNILKKLYDYGYKNIITKDFRELDLRRQSQVESFFEKECPEYVFLAAAKVGGILANNTYKAEFIYDNLMIAANVIHASYKYKVKKLLNLGSSCIYPKNSKQPIKEEYLLSDYLEETNEPYAIAKISAVKLCRYYNEQYGTNFISLMPTNLYGPGDNFNLETSHVLAALIRKFHLARLLQEKNIEMLRIDLKKNFLGYKLDQNIDLNNELVIKKVLQRLGITADYVRLWGSGSPNREFLYVEDLANAAFYIMKNHNYNEIGEIINIGCGYDIQIKDLAFLIKNIVGFKGEIKFDFKTPDGTLKKLLDISKSKKLGWSFKVDLELGIKKTYEWYLSTLRIQSLNLKQIADRVVM